MLFLVLFWCSLIGRRSRSIRSMELKPAVWSLARRESRSLPRVRDHPRPRRSPRKGIRGARPPARRRRARPQLVPPPANSRAAFARSSSFCRIISFDAYDAELQSCLKSGVKKCIAAGPRRMRRRQKVLAVLLTTEGKLIHIRRLAFAAVLETQSATPPAASSAPTARRRRPAGSH